MSALHFISESNYYKIPKNKIFGMGEWITTDNGLDVQVTDFRLGDTSDSFGISFVTSSSLKDVNDDVNFLCVNVCLKNNTSEDIEIYLSDLEPFYLLEKKARIASIDYPSEPIGIDHTLYPPGDRSFYKYVVGTGETEQFSMLYYVDKDVDGELIFSTTYYDGNSSNIAKFVLLKKEWTL